MIISLEAEKSFDPIQHPKLNQQSIEENFLRLTESTSENPQLTLYLTKD